MRNDASQGREHSPSLARQDRPAGNKSPAGANLRHQIPFVGGTRCGRICSTKQRKMNNFHTLEDAFSYVRVLQKPITIPLDKQHKIWKPKHRQRVDGGDPVRTPIDRVAARVVARAPWWAFPPEPAREKPNQNKTPNKKKRTKKMSAINETLMVNTAASKMTGSSYVASSGLTIRIINGQQCVDPDEVAALICAEIAKLPKETRPNVKAAEDARQIIQELIQGIGGEMEKFRADNKRYLEDIRNTRFAMITETSQMTGALKEVRQFFLGGDYKEEIARLKEFVDLCERLQSLKKSGFLDNVADTMLRLAQ